MLTLAFACIGTLTSCAGYYDAYGNYCSYGYFEPVFAGGACGVGNGFVPQSYGPGWGQNWGNGGVQDFGPPFEHTGYDMNGLPLSGRQSRSGHFYETGHGPDGSLYSNPTGQLKYIYNQGHRDGWQGGSLF